LKSTVSEPESWKRVIEVEVPAEEVAAAIDRKLGDYRRDARLPGFRQGKAPLSVIRQRAGETARAEVVEEMVREAYKMACDEHKIEPVSNALLTDMKNEEGEPLRFTLETEVDPPIEINGYDKLKIKPKPRKIKDSDVEENFKSLLERFVEFKDVDRPSKKGDFMRLEYRKVEIDGEERGDLRSYNPDYPVEIGGEGVFKEFDKGLTGLSAGEEAEISVKFPKDYADANAAGKSGVFSVKVLSVQEKTLPEVNEEFLKRFGNFDTVDALKEEMLKGLEEEEETRARNEAHNEAVEAILKDNPFEVPPSKIETYIKMMLEDYAQSNGGQIVEPNEQMMDSFRVPAAAALKRIRVIDYVAEKEKIKATQEEVDREIALIAQRYGHEFDDLKQIFRKNGTTNRIRLEIRERKTLDFLIGGNDNN